MTIAENSGIQSAELETSEAHPPAPGADVQKPTPPEGEAPPENAAETPEQQEAKKASKFQRRLDRHKAARVAAETEARLLRERLEKLEAQPKASQETGEPKREDFQDYESFLRACAKYDATQAADGRLKADREAQAGKEKKEQAQAGSEKTHQTWVEREKAFISANKDYESVVESFVEDELKTLSNDARRLILESEVGPGLLHNLAKLADEQPDEFERIAGLSPVRQVAELGKLEAKVSMPAKKTTGAPAPASTGSSGRSASKDPGKMDQGEYEAWRKSQGARWAR